MLKKLIKYDLIWINKFMSIYFLISLIISILTRIMSYFNSSFIGNIVYLILRGCAISCFVSIIINCVIRIWVRFKNNTYKDESYLTHTLPVSKTTLYNSKIISSITSILIAIIVIILSFIIAFLDKSIIEFLKNYFNHNLFIFISMIIITALEIIYMMNSGLLGILIGHRTNDKKVLKSVLIGIGLYFTIQLIILLIIYLLGLLNSDIASLFKADIFVTELSTIKQLMIIVSIIYLLFNTGMYLVGKKIFLRGINVD